MLPRTTLRLRLASQAISAITPIMIGQGVPSMRRSDQIRKACSGLKKASIASP